MDWSRVESKLENSSQPKPKRSSRKSMVMITSKHSLKENPDMKDFQSQRLLINPNNKDIAQNKRSTIPNLMRPKIETIKYLLIDVNNLFDVIYKL